jgi:hypothetical protein
VANNAQANKLSAEIAELSDDELGEEFEEEPLFETPLDQIDPYVFFQDFLSRMQLGSSSSTILTKEMKERQSSYYQVYINGIDAEDKALMESVIKQANKNRQLAT